MKNKIFFAAFALTILLSFFIVRPFINTILSALVFVYISFPVYKRLNRWIKHDTITAVIIILLILFLVSVPFVLIFNALAGEVETAFPTIRNVIESGELSAKVDDLAAKPNMAFLSQAKDAIIISIKNISDDIKSNASNLVFTLFEKLLFGFVMFYLMYYLFKDNKKVVDILNRLHLKLDKLHKPIISKLRDTVHAVVYGSIIVAIIQGVLAGIGFYFLGAPSPILFGLLTMIFSLIPFLGAVAVWLPLSIFVTITGYVNSNSWGVAAGIILFFYGILVISTIDNILKPKIIGSKAHVHPAIILIGVLGGFMFFGTVGVIIGPVILAMLRTFFDVYVKERLTWN